MPPTVIVTFYDNFHYEEVDISGVYLGIFGTSSEERTGRFFKPEEFKKSVVMHYGVISAEVRASGGTFKLKIKLAGKTYESSAIAYNANAAAIESAFPPEIQDPGEPIFELVGEPEVYAGVSDFIFVRDIEPGKWEFCFVESSGVKNPSGVSIQDIDVSLGAVIEEQPRYDEHQHFVELEEQIPGVEIEPSTAAPGRQESGRRRSPHGVGGSTRDVP